MNSYGGRTAIRGIYTPAQMHIDVSTQADLVGYESEDERMGRRNRSKRGTSYSKIDIREQYCINNKEVQVLESGSSALFGCLSKHHDNSCRSRHSFLSVCMSRMPSDENLQDMKLQPLPRKPIDDLERAYLRRRPKSLYGGDVGRSNWMFENDRLECGENMKSNMDYASMRRGHTISFSSEDLVSTCPAHYLPPPPPPPAGAVRTKHVSFARSHTLTSFDDAIIELRKTPQMYKSQERLILSTQPQKRSLHGPYEQRVVKKTPMKTQATQTGIGREPPTYLSLSPRTVRRVKMVSQGAQTNGHSWNGRRLMKSYSEAGYPYGDGYLTDRNKEHDVLTRTQSEEPRSPYVKQSVMYWPGNEKNIPSGSNKLDERKTTTSSSSKVYKEIFIDFEPMENGNRPGQAYTEPEFAPNHNLDAVDTDEQIVDCVDGIKVSLTSLGTVSDEERGKEQESEPRPFPPSQDSLDEEFHENLIYGGIFSKLSSSEQSMKPVLLNSKREVPDERSGGSTPDDTDVFPMVTLNVSLVSPFASCDSLANDQKDHSDGIWNESQSTVLHAESENGEISSRTPSKKLLLQHQQRSSMDTEVLDSDAVHSQSPIYSPLNQESAVPFVTVAAIHKNDSPVPVQVPAAHSQQERKSISRGLDPNVFFGMHKDVRRKMSKSPEKEEVRLDSSKATDISENSTTDDYATAFDNSGTDTSSRKSVNHQQPESKPGSKEGSSFESASSVHSFAREDAVQVVPSSPPTIAEENSENVEEHEENMEINESNEREVKHEREEKEELSGDVESSSSGSYSLDSGQRDQKPEWSDQEKARIKKEFTLELGDNSNNIENQSGAAATEMEKAMPHTKLRQQKNKFRSLQDETRTRRGQQSSPKNRSVKESGEITAKVVRSPARSEGFLSQDWVAMTKPAVIQSEEVHLSKTEVEVSSDESSSEFKNAGVDDEVNGHSPRRHRRRGGGRGRRIQNVVDHSTRKKPLSQVTSGNQQQQLNPPHTKYGRSPSHSPRGSPRKSVKVARGHDSKKTNAVCPETGTHLKTLSAESLRSVSPGSDSVFYNEGEAHILCHQCGREFEGENVECETEEATEEIVQPPAGFADSPENSKSKAYRLYKKQEKRFRSEERSGERRRHARYRAETIRAKSEERGKEKSAKSKMRPHARSTDASMERLRGADSSPSISEPLTIDEPRIYADSYKNNSWIYILDTEANPKWNRSLDTDDEKSTDGTPKDTIDSTSSEKEFKRKYQAATHRMVHRKSSMEMYKRLQSKSFGKPKFILKILINSLKTCGTVVSQVSRNN
ncbi:hypothetical protein RUM44_008949 [Polyplax serrata]|uniref:Uncharacterized protein n=1 Tax=Polyplax serrata TaxID=468196 RepID=A0ABR1ARB4_POLSC